MGSRSVRDEILYRPRLTITNKKISNIVLRCFIILRYFPNYQKDGLPLSIGGLSLQGILLGLSR